MVRTVEFLRNPSAGGSKTSSYWLPPCLQGAKDAGLDAFTVVSYKGKGHWLSLFGIGDEYHERVNAEHIGKGLPSACWDLGYLGRSDTYVRVSIDEAHPSHAWMERTEPDPSRWLKLNLSLSENYDPDGHVIVVGMGRKSRAYLHLLDWERSKLQEASERFPGRRIIYRPKLNKRQVEDALVPWPDSSVGGSIQDLLKGASLVICRHSNVAVDACIAGVPVECEAGAAHWLYSRGTTPTVKERLDFLYRLCHWQYQRNNEDMKRGWEFLIKVSANGS